MTQSTDTFPPFPVPRKTPLVVLPDGWNGVGARPLEIDVGCHKGLFLVEMAARFPERNFVGVEYQAERVEKTRRKIRALGLSNADVFCAEGLGTVQGFADASVDCIHVLFPDPWPKRRHHHKRLVQAGFLVTCLRVLKPGGLLRLVTDDEDYASAMRKVSAEFPAFVPLAGEDREYPPTEFQKKFIADGRPFYALILRVS